MNNNKNENEIKKEVKDPLLMDHEYDGIQELDHPLPSYWVNTFIMTIIFGFFYGSYHFFLNGKSLKEEYIAELKKHEEKMAALKPADTGFNLEKFNAIAASSDEMKKGEEVFVNNCVACHKEKGQGDIGPNLTDEYWINGNGNKPEFLHEIVRNGKEDMGMPPWKDILTEEEIYYTIAYVKNLKGVKLPGAKPPQGNKYE